MIFIRWSGDLCQTDRIKDFSCAYFRNQPDFRIWTFPDFDWLFNCWPTFIIFTKFNHARQSKTMPDNKRNCKAIFLVTGSMICVLGRLLVDWHFHNFPKKRSQNIAVQCSPILHKAVYQKPAVLFSSGSCCPCRCHTVHQLFIWRIKLWTSCLFGRRVKLRTSCLFGGSYCGTAVCWMIILWTSSLFGGSNFGQAVYFEDHTVDQLFMANSNT